MRTYFTADLHLGHANIIKHCNRPFKDVRHMDDTLIARWNDVVRPEDRVFILGDFAWQRPRDYLPMLPGQKILIAGNHDSIKGVDLQAFDAVHDLLEIDMDGKKVVLCHYAMRSWNRSAHGSWHLYGHSHGTLEESLLSPRCDVGVDVWGFMPVSWKEIVFKLQHRKVSFPNSSYEPQSRRTENRKFNQEIRNQVLRNRASLRPFQNDF